MDPTKQFCHNPACSWRGQGGKGNLGVHRQRDRRYICHACHQTFSATEGTAFYRLRTAVDTVTLG